MKARSPAPRNISTEQSAAGDFVERLVQLADSGQPDGVAGPGSIDGDRGDPSGDPDSDLSHAGTPARRAAMTSRTPCTRSGIVLPVENTAAARPRATGGHRQRDGAADDDGDVGGAAASSSANTLRVSPRCAPDRIESPIASTSS